MPVPFHDIAGDGTASVVAYLRLVRAPGESCILGALFVASDRGDPLEFCYTRVVLAQGPLWGADRAYEQAVTLLSRSLFKAASHLPDLVLALAGETPAEIFSESIAVQVPVCLVGETGDGPTSLQWVDREPAAGSPVFSLVESLKSRRLLLEPFQRAEQGLMEAWASQ